jgi:4-aminobutyrate aminotransferase
MSNLDYPKLATDLPGPKAKAIIEKDGRYISQSYTRGYPLVIDHAQGARLTDVDGNVFLDFTSGIAVCNTGHAHPKVVEAIKAQADRFLHMSGTDFYYASQSDLAERLAQLSPVSEGRRVFYCNSGAEAIEAALKLARYHSKRTRVLSFLGSFHGRTMGALSLSASKAIHEKGFAPLLPGVTHVPYAYCYRCGYNLTYPSCEAFCVDWIREDLFKRSIPPEEVAAIFVEPVQGEGGYVVPPKLFHEKLFQLCRDFDILYVADEIQSGMGRTGRMLASNHFDIAPDIFTLAKGIASGMPLGAMVARDRIMDWVPGSHASTFGGNPISCQAALATMDLLEGGLVDNAAVMGDRLKKGLVELQKKYDIIGDVRGLGLMVAMEMVTDRVKKTKAKPQRDQFVDAAFARGLLLLGCGECSVRFIPPLNVGKDEIDKALDITDQVLGRLFG